MYNFYSKLYGATLMHTDVTKDGLIWITGVKHNVMAHEIVPTGLSLLSYLSLSSFIFASLSVKHLQCRYYHSVTNLTNSFTFLACSWTSDARHCGASMSPLTDSTLGVTVFCSCATHHQKTLMARRIFCATTPRGESIPGVDDVLTFE